MRLKRLLLPLLALTGSVSVTSADVLDVRGPTPDHDEIADAVNAAADGDVIRVWPGDYDAFWIDDKSLTLVSAVDSGAVLVDGTYRIKNLAPHRSVEISGIGGVGIDGHALVVSDCRGSVRIREGVFIGADAFSGFPWMWDGYTAVFVTHCDDVEMTYCTARGGLPGWGEFAGTGGCGMETEQSDVSVYNSTFHGIGGTTIDDPGESGNSGADGILSVGGRLYISGCTLIGGHGGAADPDMDYWTGEYGWGGNGGWGFYGFGLIEAWFLDNVYQPGSGGWSPENWQQGDDGENTTAGTHLPGDTRLLRASRLIDDTSSIGLIFTGTPGDLVCLQTSGSPGYTFDVERGPFLLATLPAPRLRPWKILGTIDGSGVFQATIAVADLPSFGHRTRHLQGNLIGAENYFTSSSWTVILDDAW